MQLLSFLNLLLDGDAAAEWKAVVPKVSRSQPGNRATDLLGYRVAPE
jgi:hypothetical protein